MWCEVQKNGTIKYCERYTDPLTEKVKKVTTTMKKDSPQNRNKAMRLLSGKIEKLISSNNPCVNYRVSEIVELYLAALPLRGIKESTINIKKSNLNQLLRIIDKDALVNNITAQYVIKALLASGKNKTSINMYIKAFKICLNWGYENDYHSNNNLLAKLTYVKDKKEKKLSDEEVSELYLERDEVKRVLKQLSSQQLWQWYYTMQMLVLTGMRIGELIALDDIDVDLANKVIRVTKTYYPATKRTTSPKTEDSVRNIHIQPELEIIIKKLRLWRKEELFAHGKTSTLFLPNVNNGRYLRYASFLSCLKEVTLSVLGREITPHKLRHTHASILAESGMTPEQIARRLGHHDSKITIAIYIHVTKKIRDNDNKMLDAITIAK